MSVAFEPVDEADGVLKSGPLFISSKGLGWTSWKKRWFILTRTSLVFYKSDPSILILGGGETNLTLGGIALNNSGSVIVREDKKLLTILLPDGQDGRAFTLKAETSEDLCEWSTALEHAFKQAPCAGPVITESGIFISDAVTRSLCHRGDKCSAKNSVVGRPISLALQDEGGGPSFLEKALCFLEQFGSKVEGILRIAADVEEVQLRIREYERGSTDFDAKEDPHVVGDCVKYILRELPSSPVPLSCCTELLKAYELEQKEAQLNAFHGIIMEKLPQPNLLLFQRIMKMMYAISSRTPENHMTPSAVATCMAPLLLRPILAGECDLMDDVQVSDDDSGQLLAAANAARTAQAILTALLEDYQNIFRDEIGDAGNEASTGEKIKAMKNIVKHDAQNGNNEGKYESPELPLNEQRRRSSSYAGSDLYDIMDFSPNGLGFMPANHNVQSLECGGVDPECEQDQSAGSQDREPEDQQKTTRKMLSKLLDISNLLPVREPRQSDGEIFYSMKPKLRSPESESCAELSNGKFSSSNPIRRGPSSQERVSARKICSVELLDSPREEELDVRHLEKTKSDLQHRLAKEAKVNASLLAALEQRKQDLLVRRLILQQDVTKLQGQLQAERDRRLVIEVDLSQSMTRGQDSSQDSSQDSMTREELEEIALAEADVARLKQKVAELHRQLDQQQQHHHRVLSDAPHGHRRMQEANPCQRSLCHDFDATAYVNHERFQETKDISMGMSRRTVEGPESMLIADSRINEFSNYQTDNLSSTSSSFWPSAYSSFEPSESPKHPTASASSTLVELANRVNFFRRRRSQLMKELNHLDQQCGSTPAREAISFSPSPSRFNSYGSRQTFV